MDLRKNTLWIAALIGMVIAGSAVTIYVASDAEAIAELEKPVQLTKGKCSILNIEKTASTTAEVLSNQIIVEFELEYFNPDYVAIRGKVEVANNNDATVKSVVSTACEQAWETSKGEKLNTEKTVVIQYSLLNQYYDLNDKKWKQETRTLGIGG